MKYRTKAVEVEAIQYDGSNHHEVARLLGGRFVFVHMFTKEATVPLADGNVCYVDVGVWVVRKADGSCSLYYDSEFEATYEPYPVADVDDWASLLPPGSVVKGTLPSTQDVAELVSGMLEIGLPDGRTIDVGWVPEHDPAGSYRVVAYRDYWHRHTAVAWVRDRAQVVPTVAALARVE